MATSRETFLESVRSIRVWQRGDERAPNKPLLLLYALGRVSRGESRLVPYDQVHQDLGDLLQEFGRGGRRGHPEYPFWYLQNDGVWSVETERTLVLREGKQQPTVGSLRENQVPGGFPLSVDSLLRADPELVREAALVLLARHFPESIHQDILDAVGLEVPGEEVLFLKAPRPRDPRFREAVLVAYERRCAICGLEVRMGTSSLGLEAAHIRWHQARGPDEVPNGLALCVLHHKLLDRGALTIDETHRVQASELVTGGQGFEDWVLRFHGENLRPPLRRGDRPAAEHLAWHRREVFRGRARE